MEHKKRDYRNFGEMRNFFRICCAGVTLLLKKYEIRVESSDCRAIRAATYMCATACREYQCECYSKEKEKDERVQRRPIDLSNARVHPTMKHIIKSEEEEKSYSRKVPGSI